MTRKIPKVTKVGTFYVESRWNERSCSWVTETCSWRTRGGNAVRIGAMCCMPTAQQALQNHKWQVDNLRELLPTP